MGMGVVLPLEAVGVAAGGSSVVSVASGAVAVNSGVTVCREMCGVIFSVCLPTVSSRDYNSSKYFIGCSLIVLNCTSCLLLQCLPVFLSGQAGLSGSIQMRAGPPPAQAFRMEAGPAGPLRNTDASTPEAG
jgi:hypothetical protein